VIFVRDLAGQNFQTIIFCTIMIKMGLVVIELGTIFWSCSHTEVLGIGSTLVDVKIYVRDW